MAFARLVQKAAKINKLERILREEKEYSVKFASGTTGKISSRLKRYRAKLRFRRKIGTFFKKIVPVTEGTKISMFFYKLRKDGSCENFTLKSLVGFVSGFLLTYLLFMIFVFQLNMKFGTATIMCSVIGGILTIGLAFSYKVRCVVLLLLPTCFSKRGRQALLAYAFILSLTGPAKNTLNNMGILNESLACGQEQLKEALTQVIDAIKKPFYAIKDALKIVVKNLKNITKKIKELLLAIKRIVLSIVNVIKAEFQFLAKIFSVCNKEVRTPFERCLRAFEDAISDCNAKLGPYFNWLCSTTYLVQSVCYTVKKMDFICILVDSVSDSVIGVILRKIKTFILRIRTMFYVRLKFSHSFHFKTNQSKTMKEVTAGIATEFKNRTQRLVQLFDLMSCAASLFFVLAIIKVIYYRHMYLTSESFDNRYITQDFRHLDMKRAQMEVETVLPLNHRERKKYVSSTSIRLIDSEKKKLSKAAMTVFVATVKMTVYILIDYALFWTLKMIRYHARFQSKVRAPNTPTLYVTGKGFIAKLLRSIITAFQPIGIQIEIDAIPCLPDPIPPDYDRYIQIASCIVLCWILAILEPYGLRMRHYVMCYYHPLRAKERAIWLFNHILSARRSFLKFARRQLRRKVMGDKSIGKESSKQFFVSGLIDRCPFLKNLMNRKRVESCLLCGEMLQSEPSMVVRCQTPGCPVIFCQLCYKDLKNICTICQDPIEYGDYSDIDEEMDSSDDKSKEKKNKQGRKNSKDSESSTSGYSDSYQTGDRKSTLDLTAHSPSGDIEKQDLPTYASMQNFIHPELDENFLKSSRSSRPSRRRRGRSKTKSKSSKRRSSKSNKKSNRSKSNTRGRLKNLSDEGSQDLLELGMRPMRERTYGIKSQTNSQNRVKSDIKLKTAKQKPGSSAVSRKADHSDTALDTADSSDEHPSGFVPTDLSSSTDTSVTKELKPLKSKRRKDRNQSNTLFIFKGPTKTTKRSTKSFKPTKILSSLFKTKPLEAYTSRDNTTSSDVTSETEYPLQLRQKLVDRSSDSCLITELQERKMLKKSSSNKTTDSSSSDELLSKVKRPKLKFSKLRKKTTICKSTQFSNTISVDTQTSQRILREKHSSILPPPPPLPLSLQSSLRLKSIIDNNTQPTSKTSRKSIAKSVKERKHLRGGEDVLPDNIRRFLTGPKRFKLPSSQPKMFSPMKSLSGVISELKNVLGEENYNDKEKYKFTNNIEELPLPPIPINLSMDQESEKNEVDLIPGKMRSYNTTLNADSDRFLSQKIIASSLKISPTKKVLENHEMKIFRTEQEINTARQYHNMPTVRERVRAYETAFGTEQCLDGQPTNEDSQFDIYFTPQTKRNPFRFKDRSPYQVPHLNLVSDHDKGRTSQCSSPEKIVDHCHCQCDLPKRVQYEIHNEKRCPANGTCKCKKSQK